VVPKGEHSTGKFYVAIAVFIILLIILTILFTSNQLTRAKIDIEYLKNGWIDSGERDPQEGFLGLEKQDSLKYIVDENFDDKYPAFLTVTSIKTLFLMNEEELLQKTIQTINNAAINNNYIIDEDSKFEGNRILNNSHETYFVTFNGTDTSHMINETIKIIGETWNCPLSGASIICIGIAQVTDNFNDNPEENLAHWNEIVETDGLIYNVNCHN
jgi:hypothetical protein